MPLALPKSRKEIAALQSKRKVAALEQAKRAPFFRGKFDHVNAAKLDDPEEWRKIPILDKDILRSLTDAEFYANFCVQPEDGIAEYWRSGGSTGKPLFYPRSHTDIRYGLLSFRRTLDIAGSTRTQTAGVATTTTEGLLARSSNSGNFNDRHYAVVPEGNFNVGYQIFDNWRIYTGYTFVYVSSVARPGQAIDTSVGTTAAGVVHPLRGDPNTSFWMHGINLGIEARY